MDNEIISYFEMCQRQGSSLQRGMNFELGGGHSVIPMSVRHNAPYVDRFEDDGSTIIYEGHDTPRSGACPDPKAIDQPQFTPSGTLTENGKFLRAALGFKKGLEPPHPVKVYEKIRDGIWSYNGLFHLVDAWRGPTSDGQYLSLSWLRSRTIASLKARGLRGRWTAPSNSDNRQDGGVEARRWKVRTLRRE